MALYFKATSTWQVGEDSTLAQTLSSRSSSKIESTDITELVERRIAIADGTTDQAIGFTGADGLNTNALALYLTTDNPITVKINGSDTGLPVGRTAGEQGTLNLDATIITSLTVSNASGATANIFYSFPGA